MQWLFQEKQRLNQWWLYGTFIGLLLLPVILGGDAQTSYSIVYFGILISIFFLILVMVLKTKINGKEIQIHYFPFVKKTFHWNDIQEINVINYGFVGGWGIRLWTKYGTVYNTKGSIGAHIKLKNGKQLIIGTQKEKELRMVITKITSILKHSNT